MPRPPVKTQDTVINLLEVQLEGYVMAMEQQIDHLSGQLPACRGLSFPLGALRGLAGLVRMELENDLQNGTGPNATALREQARIEDAYRTLMDPFNGRPRSQQVEAMLQTLLPSRRQSVPDGPGTALKILAELLTPYVPFANDRLYNQYTPWIKRPPLYTYNEDKDAYDVDHLGKEQMVSQIQFQPAHPGSTEGTYYIRLGFQRPGGSASVVTFYVTHTGIGNFQAAVYDVVEDTYYRATLAHWTEAEVAQAVEDLLTPYGWSQEAHRAHCATEESCLAMIQAAIRENPWPVGIQVSSLGSPSWREDADVWVMQLANYQLAGPVKGNEMPIQLTRRYSGNTPASVQVSPEAWYALSHEALALRERIHALAVERILRDASEDDED